MSVTADKTEIFDFGRVMSQIAGLIGRNFVPFFVLSLLFAGLPSLLIFFIQLQLGFNAAGIQTGAAYGGGAFGLFGAVGLSLVAVLPIYVLQAALTRASIDDLSGKSVSIGAAIQAGLGFLFPLIGLAILVTLGVGAAMLAFIVPGIVLGVCWMVAAPVLIVEKTGIIQAMQRSLALTRNHRWALFGVLVLYVVAFAIVNVLLGIIIGGTMRGIGAPSEFTPGIGVGLVQAVVSSFEVLVTTVGIAAIYFELRRIKEGVGVNELASVFD